MYGRGKSAGAQRQDDRFGELDRSCVIFRVGCCAWMLCCVLCVVCVVCCVCVCAMFCVSLPMCAGVMLCCDGEAAQMC